MKSISILLKSAFIALAIFLPVTQAQGMMWSPSYWLSKTPKAAEKTVKEEAAKAAEKVAEKVVEKTTVGQYAAQGAIAAAKVAGKTVVNTAEFALDHPKLTLVTAAGAAIYLNREKIKKKLEEYKPYLKVAGGGIALAGAVIAGKNLYDAYAAYRSLVGSAPVSEEKNQLPEIRLPLKPSQEVKAQAAQASENNFDDYEALWNECQQEQQKMQEPEHVRIESERKKELIIQEAAWQDGHRELFEETAKQSPVITPSEIENYNAIYSAGVQPALLPAKAEPASSPSSQAVAQSDAPVNQGASTTEQLPLVATENEEAPEQFAQRFTQEVIAGDISHERPLIHHAYVPQPVPFRDADTPWVQEFHESEASQLTTHPWVEEFEKQQEAEKCIEELEKELDSEPVAIVSDKQETYDVRAMNRLQGNFNAEINRMRTIVGHISPPQQARVRIIIPDQSEQNSIGRVRKIVSQIQPQSSLQRDYADTNHAPKRVAQRLPASL